MSDKQVDMFLSSIVDVPVKDDQNLMEFPHFSLQKKARTEPFIYDDTNRGIRIEIQPGHKGMATIWDKDVLLYCQSLINDRVERGDPIDRTFHFAAYDFLRVTGRGTGKRAYDLLLEALDRLQSTSIRTTIRTGHDEKRERTGFSWIESFRVVEKKDKNGREIMAAIEVALNPWSFRTLVETRKVLTMNPLYFSLSKGLERRLYELARKHCGHQSEWHINLEKLWKKCGSSQELRFFKRDLKKVIEDNNVPDYGIAINFDPADKKKYASDFKGRDKKSEALMRRWGTNKRALVVFYNKKVIEANKDTKDWDEYKA